MYNAIKTSARVIIVTWSVFITITTLESTFLLQEH